MFCSRSVRRLGGMRVVGVLAALAVLLPLSGCVTVERYREVLGELTIAREVNGDLSNRLRQAETDMARISGDGGVAQANYDALKNQYDQVVSERDQLKTSLDDLEERIRNLPPMPTTGGLSQFGADSDIAEMTGEGLVFDANLLFSPGSAELRKEARQALASLAAVLKTEHSGDVLLISGHTDPTPIKSSGHKDNWDLGAKRAHAVFAQLVKSGVSPRNLRLYSAGFAEPPDGVNTSTKEGMARCRRVVLRLGGPV